MLTALASTVGDAVKRAAFSVQRGAALVLAALPPAVRDTMMCRIERS